MKKSKIRAELDQELNAVSILRAGNLINPLGAAKLRTKILKKALSNLNKRNRK